MSKFSKRVIQALEEAVEIARGERPARVWVFCHDCKAKILINYLPDPPRERFLCADCSWIDWPPEPRRGDPL